MEIKLDIETAASKLAQRANTHFQKDNDFELEYIISGITEEILLEEGFNNVGFTQSVNCLIYKKENLYGLLLGDIFRLGKGISNSEENYEKIKNLIEEFKENNTI